MTHLHSASGGAEALRLLCAWDRKAEKAAIGEEQAVGGEDHDGDEGDDDDNGAAFMLSAHDGHMESVGFNMPTVQQFRHALKRHDPNTYL